jgi:membrane dipeptidase
MKRKQMDSRGCLLVDAHSDVLVDVIRKRTLGRKRVIEEDWAPNMKKGGIDVRVAAIYVDGSFLPEMALRKSLDFISALNSEVNESPSIEICTTCGEIRKTKGEGKIGLIISMEGAEPLSNDINLLQVFHKLGLRILTITHDRRNYAGDGSFMSPRTAGEPGGLTNFGVRLVQAANDLGIVVDVTHLNDPGFWDVIEVTRSPIIASHSNCRSLCDHPRNLTDDQIRVLGEKGGVIGVNSVPMYVNKKLADVDHVLNHIDHLVDVAGEKSVGLGFDFYEYLLKYFSEEERGRFPSRALSFSSSNNIMKDEDVPNVVNGLVERGYSDNDIRLILGENFLRVFKKSWKS